LLGQLLNVRVLRLLQNFLGQCDLGLVVYRGSQDEQLVGSGLGVGGDLSEQLIGLLLGLRLLLRLIPPPVRLLRDRVSERR
jgi:hypothetical protein